MWQPSGPAFPIWQHTPARALTRNQHSLAAMQAALRLAATGEAY